MPEKELQDNSEIKIVDHVPLHCHSHFSLLDGFCSPDKLALYAKQNGFRAIALTDHGSCAGLFAFYKACKKLGIKPILGVEAYLVDNIDSKEQGENRLHVTLLAKNKIGYKNLIAITSISYLRGFYFKPRVDFNILKQHREGIICGSACVGGIIADPILNGDINLAKSNAAKFKELYGDDFFAEIMLHTYEDKEKEEKFKKIMRQVYLIAKEYKILPVATCDSHYVSKDDGKIHDIILCISTKDTIKNPNRMSFGSSDFYLKSYDELMELYSKSPELVTNSVIISDKIEDNLIEIGKDLLPDFHLPPGVTSEKDYLKSLIDDGMKSKKLSGIPEYEERIKEEWDIINGCGFAKYFLILWDVVAFARREKIRIGPGRGSGVASLCLYCLGITQLDPIKYDLMFWRFLNKDRISPPDVDMDFEYTRQEEIFKYVQSKYGIQCTTRIGTYNGLKAKDAVRRVAKALDIGNDYSNDRDSRASWKSGEKTLSIVDGMTKAIPTGPDIKLEDVINLKFKGKINEKLKKQIEDLREFIEKYPDVFECAKKVEGSLSAAGVHPAGIIVCRDPIVEHVPLRTSSEVICTQYNLKEVEELGLLKFDFLALKTLTLIDYCIRLVEQRRWKNTRKLNIDIVEPNDKGIFDMLSNGDTDGVFQFEGWGITKLLQEIHVDSFEDMIVANAMYRPGTLNAKIPEDYCKYKHGQKEIEYVHPQMKEILHETYGMMVYQEQVMLVSMKMAGFTSIEADTLRKGIGKKEPEKIMKLKDKFVSGCIKNGVDEVSADRVFELCKYFGGYGFNRSHSAAYAYLAYQTAWLKFHFRPEFMCALLSSVTSEQNKEQRSKYEDSLPRFGLELLPYDINMSKDVYTIEEKNTIRPPLSSLRGVGVAAIKDIVSKQPYANLNDFARKHSSHSSVNKSVFAALIDAGCMREWGSDKNKMIDMFEKSKAQARSIESVRKKKEQKDKQFEGSFFDN